MKPKRIGGWQVWVDLYEDHVVKTPKSRKEVEYNVKRYLKSIGKSHKTKETVDKAFEDMANSIKIIKKSKMPVKYFAYPEFLEEGRLKQKKVTSMDEKLKELIKKKKISEIKKLIKKFIKFQHKIWKYGIHEQPIKFNLNFGVIGNNVVLIDLFELTTNKEKVRKRILKRPWKKHKIHYMRSLPEWVIDYFIEQADKGITIENLNKYWKTK